VVFPHVKEWYTVDEASLLCGRAKGTIYNLLSKYKLPRQYRRDGRNYRRHLAIPAETLVELQHLTVRN
jgi:Ni/Co efflux regulator RcnB